MNLGELIQAARLRVDDLDSQGYLHSDEEMKGHANEGAMKLSWITLCIRDSTTPEICEINLVAGQSVYEIDQRIIGMYRFKIQETGCMLGSKKFEQMDMNCPGWEDETGEPTHLILGMDSGSIRVYPTPDADYTLRLTVARTPLVPMELPDETPERAIKEMWHPAIVAWMVYRCFTKRDVEAENMIRANQARAEFHRICGKNEEEANAAMDNYAMNHGWCFNDGRE